MRAVSIIIRFVQLLATIPVGLGLSNAGSFFELLNGLAHGQPWDFAEFAKRWAAFSSPTGFGVALMLGLELLLGRGEMTHARSLRFPKKPWLWKRMWAERRIRLSNRTPVAICLAALGILAFVIVPVGLWMKSRMPDAPVYIGLGVLGLFPLALMRMIWLNRRWGRSELEILTLPGVIGGPFRGTVILSESLPEGTALRVTLNCIRIRTIRMYPSGDSHSTTDTIWQDQKILVTALSMVRPNGVAIPCSFAIPFSCEPTSLDTIGFSSSPDSDPNEHVSIHWQLSVGMKDPLDVRAATFEIPVFRTESSSLAYKEDVAVDALYLEPVDVDALLESIPFRRESSMSGERLRFSLMRKRDFFLLLVFTLAVTLGVLAIFRYVSLPGALFGALLPVVLAIACYKTLVEGLTWNADIEITAKATTFTAGYIWSRRRYEFARGRLPRLECHPEFRRLSGSTYCLRMIPAEDSPCIIVKRLDGKQNAVAVRDWLMKELWKA
jgi:hypothetical protein